MPKRKKRTKSVKRTTRAGITQSVKIVIGSTAPKRKARSYLKPSNTQGHNLMTPQLISTRQEPFDLALLGNLQQRMNKIDNLNKGVYDRDFAEEAQRQLRQEAVEEKKSGEAVSQMVAEDMSKQKPAPVAKQGRPILPVGLPYPQGPELPTSAGISTLDPAYGLPVAQSRPLAGPKRRTAVEAELTVEQQRTALDDFLAIGKTTQPSTLDRDTSKLGITSTGLLVETNPVVRQTSVDKPKKERIPLTQQQKDERKAKKLAKAQAKEEQGTAL